MVSKSVLQEQMAKQEYKYGFVSDLDEDKAPKGLNEDIVRLISRKKNEPEWFLEWRLRAYRHWLTMKEPKWSNVTYPPINYQDIIYYASPASRSMRSSTASPSRRRSRTGSRSSGSSSARSPRRSRNIRTSCGSTWAPSYPSTTTSSQVSTAPSSATGHSPTSRRASGARWNCRHISGSTRRTRASSSAP